MAGLRLKIDIEKVCAELLKRHWVVELVEHNLKLGYVRVMARSLVSDEQLAAFEKNEEHAYARALQMAMDHERNNE